MYHKPHFADWKTRECKWFTEDHTGEFLQPHSLLKYLVSQAYKSCMNNCLYPEKPYSCIEPDITDLVICPGSSVAPITVVPNCLPRILPSFSR